MSRKICCTCQRPQKVCICGFIKPIHNVVEVAILQHPNEATQIKGTACIAALSLQQCQIWVGESLTDLPGLVAWLNKNENVFLLYPAIENLKESTEVWPIERINQSYGTDFKVLVLDGTWRKTFKMMQLNESLRKLKRIELTPVSASQYRVRKQKDSQSLSTVEAVYELMSQIESQPQKFQPLLETFEAMQNQQLAFRK